MQRIHDPSKRPTTRICERISCQKEYKFSGGHGRASYRHCADCVQIYEEQGRKATRGGIDVRIRVFPDTRRVRFKGVGYA